MNYLETKCLTYTLGLSEITEHSYSEILKNSKKTLALVGDINLQDAENFLNKYI